MYLIFLYNILINFAIIYYIYIWVFLFILNVKLSFWRKNLIMCNLAMEQLVDRMLQRYLINYTCFPDISTSLFFSCVSLQTSNSCTSVNRRSFFQTSFSVSRRWTPVWTTENKDFHTLKKSQRKEVCKAYRTQRANSKYGPFPLVPLDSGVKQSLMGRRL